MNTKRNKWLSIAAGIIITIMLVFACFTGTRVTASENTEVSEGIEFIDVEGDQFKGKLMIITDPSRVFCGVIPEFGETEGMVVLDIIEEYREQSVPVLGGINAGAFLDNGSDVSYTGLPVGIVISEGEIVYQEAQADEDPLFLVGFTMEDQLIMETADPGEISEMDLRDAVCIDPVTSPFLIRSGEIVEDLPTESDFGGSKNPRTAIGQREDGAVLLLVIDGRQTDSLGATCLEAAQCMQEYGAVHAALMTGGNSSQMAYEGELQNSPYSPTGPRKCPTAWLILP